MESPETRKKVLIYTDDSGWMEYLANFIPLIGRFEPVTASTPTEALAKVNALDPVLTLYDTGAVLAPHHGVLTEIHGKHPDALLLVVVPTGKDAAVLHREGMSHIFARPVTASDLSHKLKELLLTHEDPPNREFAKLLIADDESEVGELLADVFQPLGIEVYTASDGREALDVFKKNTCNLAIVDLTMPEIKGTELVKMLEAGDEAPKPKFIVIMTAALGETISELRRLGYPVIAKPMDLENLEKNVLAACEKYHLALKQQGDSKH